MFLKRFKSGLLFFAAIVLAIPAGAQDSLIERVQRLQESIVTIQAQTQDVSSPDGRRGVFERTGSGIIIDPSGYIVTNTHTILYAKFIFATLHNGTRLAATIAVIAPQWDLTILKIDAPSKLKAVPWADSNRIALGDPIIALGNSGLLKETISGGTVKAIGRKESGSPDAVDMIETDLNVYNGDSGGPILNGQGEFLGIIAAKNIHVGRSSWAIPSNKIREQLISYLQGVHP